MIDKGYYEMLWLTVERGAMDSPDYDGQTLADTLRYVADRVEAEWNE